MLNTKKFFKKTAISILCSSLIIGCSNKPAEQDNQKRVAEIQRYLMGLRDTATSFEINPSHISSDQSFAILGKPFEIKEEIALPPIFDQNTSFGKVDEEPFEKVIEKLNRKYQKFGVVISFTDDAAEYLSNQEDTSSSSSNSANNAVGGADSTSTIINPFNPISLNTNTTSVSTDELKSKYKYYLSLNIENSTLRSYLDILSANTNLWWKYEEGRVYFYRFDQKTFPIDLDNSTYAVEASQGNSSSSDDSASSAYQLKMKTKEADPFENLLKQVETYLSTAGKLSINRHEGSITVVDTPLRLKKIEKRIHDFNYAVTTQYAINVDIYEVITDITDNGSFSWQAVFQTSDLAFNMASPLNFLENTGSFKGEVLSGKFKGTKSILDLLYKTGSAANHIKNTGRTKNNIPTPLASTEDKGIISGKKSFINKDGIVESSTDTKTITEGFTVSAKPRLLSDGRIDVQIIANLNRLKDLKTVGESDSEIIQLEEIKKESAIANAIVRSGQTVMITGYEKTLTSSEKQSLGQTLPWWTGGSNKQQQLQSSLLIFVTPIILRR